MPNRTIMTQVTFKNPFSLGAHDDPQPPGKYTVETDEERLEGLSFIAYRRVRTVIHIPSRLGRRGISQVLMVDPNELKGALESDARPPAAPTNTDTGQKVPRSRREMVRPAADRQAIERSENEGMPDPAS